MEQEQQGAGTALPGALPRGLACWRCCCDSHGPVPPARRGTGLRRAGGAARPHAAAPGSSGRPRLASRLRHSAGCSAPRGCRPASSTDRFCRHRGARARPQEPAPAPAMPRGVGHNRAPNAVCPLLPLTHRAEAGKRRGPVRDLPWPPSSCRRSRGAGSAAPSRPPGTARLWVRGRVSTGGTTGTCTHSSVPTPSRCGGAAAPALRTHGSGAQPRMLLPHNPVQEDGALTASACLLGTGQRVEAGSPAGDRPSPELVSSSSLW